MATDVFVPVWSQSDEDKFRRLITVLLVLTIVISVVIPFVPLPEITREAQERLPPQFAEIILRKPEPVPAPPIPLPEPEFVVDEAKPPEVKEEVIQAPVVQTVQQAREKAKSAGVLAFQDDLAAMREALDTSVVNDTNAVQRGSGEAATLDRSLLTAGTGGKQASVNVADLSRETGGVALSGLETTVVEAPVEEVAARTGAVRTGMPQNQSTRSIEDVRRVFDANKGAIYAIYNRALRSDPGLLGKVVLELVIEPDGTVSECLVVTSELNSEELVSRIVQRVQMFDFGARDVGVTRISYPVHFLPS